MDKSREFKINVLVAGVLLDKSFDYLYESPLEVGTLVKVSFGKRAGTVKGLVLGSQPFAGDCKIKLKKIDEVLDLPCIGQSSIDFLQDVAYYNCSYASKILSMMIYDKGLSKIDTSHSQDLPALPKDFKLNKSQQEAVDKISCAAGLSTAGSSDSVSSKSALPAAAGLSNQDNCANADKGGLVTSKFERFLLYGVPGSGKSEIFLSLVPSVINKGKQVLILIPEIGLTGQFKNRFKKLLGVEPMMWTSSSKMSEKRKIWQAALFGLPIVVMGTRSALFLPFANLGIIMVDEEQDKSYKQDSNVLYNARDMSILKANRENCPVVFGSATPSMETLWNVKRGAYNMLELENRKATMPEVVLADINENAKGKSIGKVLEEDIKACLQRGEQAMLFVNRRGHSPLVLCKACGGRIMCKHCDTYMIYYKSDCTLKCHYCNDIREFIEETYHCDDCGKKNNWLLHHIGIEKIAQQAAEMFPDIKIKIITGEKSLSEMEDIIKGMDDGSIDLLIGTQIIAKGYDFSKLTLVGIIDAELDTREEELRGRESMFQMLMQVGGRAGRVGDPDCGTQAGSSQVGDKYGKVIIQTRFPESDFIQRLVSWDYIGWSESEMKKRQELNQPPFSRLVCFLFKGKNKEKVAAEAKFAQMHLETMLGSKYVLGRSEALISPINNVYRFRLMLRFDNNNFAKVARDLIKGCRARDNSVRMDIDVNPYNIIT